MISDSIVALVLLSPAIIALIAILVNNLKAFKRSPKLTRTEQELWDRKIQDIRLKSKSTHKEMYNNYLSTSHWKRVREEALERAEYKCQLCGISNVTFNVHHNSYKNVGHERASDLIVLCRKCHARHHHKKY